MNIIAGCFIDMLAFTFLTLPDHLPGDDGARLRSFMVWSHNRIYVRICPDHPSLWTESVHPSGDDSRDYDGGCYPGCIPVYPGGFVYTCSLRRLPANGYMATQPDVECKKHLDVCRVGCRKRINYQTIEE